MNIYLITEDGENFCIKAKTAGEAINVCEKSYIDEILETQPGSSLESEKEYYYEQILQSCSLVGQLKN